MTSDRRIVLRTGGSPPSVATGIADGAGGGGVVCARRQRRVGRTGRAGAGRQCGQCPRACGPGREGAGR
eukprot:10518352-Alexandrium_andersonii.AAC.1